jgi:hypothetical protein
MLGVAPNLIQPGSDWNPCFPCVPLRGTRSLSKEYCFSPPEATGNL